MMGVVHRGTGRVGIDLEYAIKESGMTESLGRCVEPRKLDPVQDRRNDSYFLTEGPNGGDRGMNPYYHGRGIFRYDSEKHSRTKMAPSDFTVAARFAVGSANST